MFLRLRIGPAAWPRRGTICKAAAAAIAAAALRSAIRRVIGIKFIGGISHKIIRDIIHAKQQLDIFDFSSTQIQSAGGEI